MLGDCPPGIVDCDLAAANPAALPTVDVLARLALAARRSFRELRLEHASPEIVALLELCGLGEVLRCADEASAPAILGAPGGSGGEVVR